MYDTPHQFEPLIPGQEKLVLVREQAADIARRSIRLASQAHPTSRETLRELVRAMNSYYSNRIEGQGTHPLNIDRALHANFSSRPEIARLQRIAVAHIEAERSLEDLAEQQGWALDSGLALTAHAELYGRLQAEDRVTDDGEIVEPGQLRRRDVQVGMHVPPRWQAIPRFFEAFDRAYKRKRSWDESLLLIACAHHRMAWIHPFIDGNGRAVRLQTHAVMSEISQGLWSANRGLARDVGQYYAHLAAADIPRQGDLDGRGNLTERGLIDWVQYFLRICSDQVDFMSRMLDMDNMKTRIEALITFRSTQDPEIRREAVLPLYHLFAAGPLTRGEFSQMSGMGERTSRKLIARLLQTGLITSPSTHGLLRFALPLDALQFLLPGLYPEAAAPLD